MEPQLHSRLGIASFITSLASGVVIFLIMVIAGVMSASPGGMNEQSAGAITIGLFLFGFLFVSLVALVLGIFGLCQKDRKKIFAILGTTFSSVTIVGVIFIMALGLAMG